MHHSNYPNLSKLQFDRIVEMNLNGKTIDLIDLYLDSCLQCREKIDKFHQAVLENNKDVLRICSFYL